MGDIILAIVSVLMLPIGIIVLTLQFMSIVGN